MPAQSPTPMPMEMPSEMMPAQTPPPAVDCTNIPAGPFKLDSVAGATASEDLAFDNMGNLIGSDDFSIYKATSAGNKTVFVPNMQFRAGLRALPTGDLVVADNTTGSLVRIDASGTKHTVKSGLVYPNGLEVDMEGRVYVTEHDARRVRRIDPYSGDEAIVVDGDIENPNGLSFSPDYRTLYIGGFSGAGIIYALAIGEDGTPGALTEWATGVGTGYLDGMGVDACGNVYVCDYEGYAIYRISATDKKRVLIIDGNDAGLYLPNLQWGSGVGGWDPLTLYIPDGENHGVYKTSIGVPSKPRAYP
jgi:sugar lactone lactonase YvrE